MGKRNDGSIYSKIETKFVRPTKILWEAPTKMHLDLGDENGIQEYDLLKGAAEYMHTQVGVKLSTSKELYKNTKDIWKEFIDNRLESCKDEPNEKERFTLDKETLYFLVTDTGVIVDIKDFKTSENVEDFRLKHQKFVIDMTSRELVDRMWVECKGGLMKMICYKVKTDLTKEDYTPSILLELNPEKSTYQAHRCIFSYLNPYMILPTVSCDIYEKSMIEFITRFDMKNFLEFTIERADELVDAYNTFKTQPVEISVREMLNLFKRLGYKLELDDIDKLKPIDDLRDDDSNQQIQDFFNTFTTGETAYDIMHLSEIKKAFRYNKVTLLDVLSILSKEYLNGNAVKVVSNVLGDVVFKLFDSKNVDKIQVDSIKIEK